VSGKCPVSKCDREVHEDNEVMCDAHWRRVPGDLKREVNSARAKVRRLSREFPTWREAEALITATQDRQESESTAIGEVELQEFEEKQAERKAAKA
jgi:hypothetical protein